MEITLLNHPSNKLSCINANETLNKTLIHRLKSSERSSIYIYIKPVLKTSTGEGICERYETDPSRVEKEWSLTREGKHLHVTRIKVATLPSLYRNLLA